MHRGHGHWPLSRMVAIKALQQSTLAMAFRHKFDYSLFGIVSRINKDSGINSSPNTIPAGNDHPVFVGFKKLVIEYDFPTAVEKFPAAMGKQ